MKLRALVVDDSRVMRNMVMATIRRTTLADFEFVEAEDGLDALHKFSPEKIDIIFADWNMPNLNGIDFVRRVRGNPKARQVPIVMVTSERTVGKMEEALDRAGADAFISKPFTVDEMELKLTKVLARLGPRPDAKPGGFFSKLMGNG